MPTLFFTFLYIAFYVYVFKKLSLMEKGVGGGGILTKKAVDSHIYSKVLSLSAYNFSCTYYIKSKKVFSLHSVKQNFFFHNYVLKSICLWKHINSFFSIKFQYKIFWILIPFYENVRKSLDAQRVKHYISIAFYHYAIFCS